MLKTKQLVALIFLVLAICVNISGCSGKSGAKKPEQNQKQKTKAPEGLETIRENIEIIISETGAKLGIIPLQEDVREEPDTKQERSGEEKGLGSTWKEEEEALVKIHQNWNAIEPEAIKADLDEKARIDYERTLDELTINIGKHLSEESLLAAVNLYNNHADIAELFDTLIPAEFFRVKYKVMMATIEAARNNWQNANQHMDGLEEKWDDFQVQAKKGDEKVSECSKYSLNDLQNAVKSEQIDLVMVKSGVVMKNLQKLEDRF